MGAEVVRAIFYHGLADRRELDDYFATMFCDPHDFEEQVALLRRHWQPMSLAEIHDHLVDRRPFPPRAVHVSFDDGYRNVLTAAETLDRYHVPWTLFVVGDAVLGNFRPWYSRLGDALANSTYVRRPDGSLVDLTSPRTTKGFERMVKAEVLTVPTEQMETVLEAILRLPGISRPAPERWPYLNQEELGQLRDAGVEIGNHSARHVNLVRCNDTELEAEVNDSRTRLEAALCTRVRFFAYPDGRFNRRVARAVGRSHDLAMATSTIRQPMDHLAIRRLSGRATASQLEARLISYPTRRLGFDLGGWRWDGRARVSEAAYRLARGTAPLSRMR